MLESSSGVLETRTDNSAVELHQTDEYFQSNNEVKNSVSTGHYGDQSKIPRDEKLETSEKTSISREVDLGSMKMEPEQGIGELASDAWLGRNTSRFVGALAESQKVHFVTGSSYEGTWDALGMAGVGRYVLPNGAIYEGEIRDGMFHGQGSFYWSENQRLDVVHFRGELKDYRYQFQDGLNYEDTDWKYCKFPDRRFYESIKNGLKPGGRTLKTARRTAKVLPAGCYDAGDGVFDPTTQQITSYDDSEKVLRFPSSEEYAWILKKCRKSWSEPTGYHPELNENWSEKPPKLPYNLPMSQDSPDHWWKRLTTFTRDPNSLGGGSYGTYGPGLSRHETLSIPRVCMCCETVLIGEPCRCIHSFPSSHEGEDDKLQRIPSDQMYENEYENCESSPVFLETDADFTSSETHVDSLPKILAEFSEDIAPDKSSNRPRSYNTLRKSIRSLENAKQYQDNDEGRKMEHFGGSKTDTELSNFSNDGKIEISGRKQNKQNIQKSQNVIEREILQNDNRKSFTRKDDNPETILSAIISNQNLEKSDQRNDEPPKNLGKSSIEKSSSDQKLDHSTDLISREKVSRETVPEASEDHKLEMKLLPEHVSQQYKNQMEIETMEEKTQRDFPQNRETENSSKIIRQSLNEHSDKSGGTIISEPSAIREELRGNFESKNQESNNEVKTLLDDNAENKSQYDEQSSAEAKPKVLATNTLENMQSDENSRPDFIQNSQSILETKEKIKIHESLSSKINTDGNLISRTFDEKLPLITTEIFTDQKTLDSIAEQDSNHSFNNISTVELENNTSNHDKESSIESKNEFDSNDVKKLKSIKKSQVELIDADKSLSDSEKKLKTYISTSSRTKEIPEISEIIPGQKSAVTLNLKTMEKSSSTGFSSRWEETKGSISLDREKSTSLNKLHPSLASLKTTRQKLSKENTLVEIYNKHSNKEKPTYKPMNSNVWRLSSANQNYGPETKIKNLLFHPALTSPRLENVVYVRKPCDHRACTTSIRDVRASASRTGKEYPSNISSKTLSTQSNENVKK